MGLLGSVPWSLNCGYYTIISLQLWNMTCYCTVHRPSMEAPSNKLQVVMHHMWWSSPKSNSKIQHQKQSFLGKLYSIMAWNWHEWIPLSVLSTVEVFSSTILHIFTCPRKQYEGVHFQFIQRALHTASVDSNFLCKIRHFMCFNPKGTAVSPAIPTRFF